MIMLFDNVGKKICIMSKILFFISVIGALLLIILALGDLKVEILMISLILVVSAFLVFLPLYGFGQLILNVQEIRNQINQA